MIITWIFLGLVLGFIGNNFLSREAKSSPVGILAGLIGAILGGVITWMINSDTSFMLNVGATTIAALVLMVVYHKIVRPAMS